MGQSLNEIAQTLKDANKKVQLIYAFNGTGKTRLSREFKELIAPKEDNGEEQEISDNKVIYYNAFTEDLFHWDNAERKLKIQSNIFTKWILEEQGQEENITKNFQRYTNDKLTPRFNEDFSEVRFSFERGDDSDSDSVKISKGEESCFIWSLFYSFLKEIKEALIPRGEAESEVKSSVKIAETKIAEAKKAEKVAKNTKKAEDTGKSSSD